MTVCYDREGDFLEVTFEQLPATTEEVAEDVLFRRSQDGRVVGFAVLNFSKHSLEGLMVPLEVKAQSAA